MDMDGTTKKAGDALADWRAAERRLATAVANQAAAEAAAVAADVARDAAARTALVARRALEAAADAEASARATADAAISMACLAADDRETMIHAARQAAADEAAARDAYHRAEEHARFAQSSELDDGGDRRTDQGIARVVASAANLVSGQPVAADLRSSS